MSVKESIEELRRLGYKVEARKRSDGGYIITSINGLKFSGATGNTYARSLLGEELSQKRAEQLTFNVKKYIKGAKKKATLDEEMKKELRKVQRKWRKNKVTAHITSKKVKEHIKSEGRAGAKEYLRRMSRYGEGLAYEENVEYLARYVEDVALSVRDRELQNASFEVANYIRSKKPVFKEEWIADVYSYWYAVIEAMEKGLGDAEVPNAIMNTYAKIG